MKAYERFLKYVSVWTTSDENSETVPSADRELVLAKLLVEEMKELGIEDARVDEKGYVYGSVPATLGCENAPALGLIAHMDTAPDAPGDNIHPQIIENYDGKDVVLGTSGKTIKVEEFPYLADLKGRTLITTDGTTLLGADDKAGIAEVLTVIEEILTEHTAGEYRFLFHTIPVMIWKEAALKELPAGMTIIDIASGGGGVDHDYCQCHGIRAKLCPGLPGKYAPKTSAKILHEYIVEQCR